MRVAFVLLPKWASTVAKPETVICIGHVTDLILPFLCAEGTSISAARLESTSEDSSAVISMCLPYLVLNVFHGFCASVSQQHAF